MNRFRFSECVQQKTSQVLFLVMLIVHLVVVFVFASNLISIPESASDHATYISFGTQIAHLLQSGTYTWGAVYPFNWFPLFVGTMFAIVGAYPVVFMLINALLVSFAGVLVYRSILLTGISKRTACITSFAVFCLYESLVIYSSLILKEPFAVFLAVGIVVMSLRMLQSETFKWKYFFGILIAFVLLRDLRYFTALGVLIGFFVGWFIAGSMHFKKRLAVGFSMLLAFSCVAFLLTGEDTIGKNGGLFHYSEPKFIHDLRVSYYRSGDTTQHISVVDISPVNVPSKITTLTEGTSRGEVPASYHFSTKGIAQSFLIVVFGPFPWQLPLRTYIFILPDMLLWYGLWVLALIGLFRKWRKSYLVPAVSAACIIGALTLGVDNLGALLRYRIVVLVLVSIVSAGGVEWCLEKIRQRKQYGAI